MKKFTIEKIEFDDVLVITPNVFHDHRGYFCETYNIEKLLESNFSEVFVQDNESKSGKNVLRGLHYQWQPAMGKLVRCVSGEIQDVIVDIRTGSPTYGKHFSIRLSETNKKQLWVPAGYAHGILSLKENTIISYKCSGVYNSTAESGINPLDPALNIVWDCNVRDIILSDKDRDAQTFEEYSKQSKFIYEKENV
jgi:dTDP-4-dehydrorhamnose 3,5-epimerase